MNNYFFKDPTPFGREFLVEKFNKEFNVNINYRFFKKNLDQLKRKYKKYKQLMQNSTGISVDPVTSVISASNSWWKDRESQYSVHQRREELMNEGINDDETQVSKTQKNEEVPASIVQQQGGLRRGSSSQRGAGTSQISIGSGSRGNRRKQSFESTLTDTMNGFREFQRQSLEQLRPNIFDQDDYEELRQIPQRQQMDRRYWPYFSGFIGVMDGLHDHLKTALTKSGSDGFLHAETKVYETLLDTYKATDDSERFEELDKSVKEVCTVEEEVSGSPMTHHAVDPVNAADDDWSELKAPKVELKPLPS
ncbi:uncharacterized protein LOC111829246 [Capsella rubella]|uniref:uncharacterized protein LOC111829246 n=1 Tax=Capsella rubella TaxID=81985 RepID=UPI000CD4F4A0|nr:uncharacterized protein LOC111829246 [Capsella rubella]